MSQDAPNPFNLPGMNAAFMSAPNNPVLTSMEMMRQAMTSMGYGANAPSGQPSSNPMAPEELEKRIGELRVVENWLKLNLSMLGSTIQGMEVQLATVKTLQSFAAMGQAGQNTAATTGSPLEVALGMKPTPGHEPNRAQSAATQGTPAVEPLQQAAAQNWWNMLEDQFSQIAAASTKAAQMASDPPAKPRASAGKSKSAGASKKAAGKTASPTKTTKTKSS